MPQLNPSPWFFALMMSWLIYLMFLPKSNNLKMINEPLTKNNKHTFNSWNWSWT